MRETGCRCCGKELKQSEGRGRRRKFCSYECRHTPQGVELSSEPCVCKHCGEPTKYYASTGKPKTYCSTKCRALSRYSKRVIYEKQCNRCGKQFKTKTSRKHCSEACAKDSRREKSSKTFASKRIAQCLACGKEFVARKKKYMTCCSRECGWKLITIRAMESHKPCLRCGVMFGGKHTDCNECRNRCVRFGMKLRNCRDCGVTFPYRVQPGGGKERCDACLSEQNRKSAIKWYRTIKGAVSIPGALSIHEYRAAKAGVPSEHVDLIEVFKRDNWTCQICGKKTKASSDPHHPLRAVLDHIIPISKGGPHLYTNVQCTHRRCNGLKGDRMRQEQLLLIG